SYNYLDYRFQNPTGTTFQLLVWTTDTHLCGELRADADLPLSWHIRSEEETFVREGDRVYRNNVIARECVDKRSGNLLSRETLKRNHALVLYEVPEDRIMEEI
nr:vancomycin resistance protein [Bilophila sp.]